MASATHSSELRTVRRQMAALQQRVSWLERALKPKGRAAVPRVHLDRRQAEDSARNEAMLDYWEQQRIEQFRQNPQMLHLSRERERKINAFLRERGIRPEKSDLRKIAKQLADEAEK